MQRMRKHGTQFCRYGPLGFPTGTLYDQSGLQLAFCWSDYSSPNGCIALHFQFTPRLWLPFAFSSISEPGTWPPLTNHYGTKWELTPRPEATIPILAENFDSQRFCVTSVCLVGFSWVPLFLAFSSGFSSIFNYFSHHLHVIYSHLIVLIFSVIFFLSFIFYFYYSA